MEELIEVCNRCGSDTCWRTGKGTCRLDNLPRESASVPRIKVNRQKAIEAKTRIRR